MPETITMGNGDYFNAILDFASLACVVGCDDAEWPASFIASHPQAVIHAIIPDSTACAQLAQHYENENRVILYSVKNDDLSRFSLDAYCRSQGITRITVLQLHVPAQEAALLHTGLHLLERECIDLMYLRPESFLDEKGVRLFDFLERFRFIICGIQDNDMILHCKTLQAAASGEFHSIVAVNSRFASGLFKTRLDDSSDYAALADLYAFDTRGIVCVNVKNVNHRSRKGIKNRCAIETAHEEDTAGTDQKRIEDDNYLIKTLNHTLAANGLTIRDFSILEIEDGNAEHILHSLSDCIPDFEAILCRVHFTESYQHPSFIYAIDDMLQGYGFTRVMTDSPGEPQTGTALYVKKPAVSLSTLGKNGRFGNQIFQYAFLKTYARTHDLRIETPRWIGQELFGLHDPPLSRVMQTIYDWSNDIHVALIPNATRVFKNINFWGWFQYHTTYYAPHKEFFRSLFKPVPAITKKVEMANKKLHRMGKTIIGLHIRRGDYGYGSFFLAPHEWYLDWLKNHWHTFDSPVLFIASDDPAATIPIYSEYNPVTFDDLGVSQPIAPFYPDFYLLHHCDVMAVSNSSFSIAACMLNESAQLFLRPSLTSSGLIPFDPWNTEVLLKERVEEKNTPDYVPSAEDQKFADFTQKILTLIKENKVEKALQLYDFNRGKFQPGIDVRSFDRAIAEVKLRVYGK